MRYFSTKEAAHAAIIEHQKFNDDTYYSIRKGKRGFYVSVSVQALTGTIYRL